MIGKVQFVRHARGLFILSLAMVGLCACSSRDIQISKYSSVNEAVDAATGPLEDLNIKKREIPEPLIAAMKSPYAAPEKPTCDATKREITALDDVLGPDLTPYVEKQGEGEFMSLANFEAELPSADGVPEMAFDAAKGMAISSIQSQVNIIPFRSIVRKVTGADRYQKKVTRAYEAGKLRRAYLKGYAQERFGKLCLSPPPVVEASADTKRIPPAEPPASE
jgi:hypothetical protein